MRTIQGARIALMAIVLAATGASAQTNWTVLGWNNLGMHCMDSDYSVFSILPPYNTIHAQVIDANGKLVTNATGIGVTYSAIADANGSFNATSKDKGNFWQYSSALFGIALPENTGLPVPGPEMFTMPGTNNIPQGMKFETGFNWFAAYGVPITPYDDAGRPNQYPMMRLTVTNASGQVLARSDIVLPVSDEMDCKLCHSSGSGPDAEPGDGWVYDLDPGRDYRLNILRIHDEMNLNRSKYRAALAAKGFNTNGLFATVTVNKQPILCAACHLSEALPGSGITNIPPLTEAMHSRHANVVDPRNSMSLGSSENRLACYSCHPGSVTRCLRGAMGKSVASDGSMAMQCQSCHGGMEDVGSSTRTGWLEEPNCQACHAGGANNSYGVIRFLDAMTNGALRVTTDQRFATSPNTPGAGLSLYRFSKGHGGLQCSACHGSTHAEFPSALPSDNVGVIELQGHAGVVSECTACHKTMPVTISGGPHGMHPTGSGWLNAHKQAAENGLSGCRACHGTNDRGTELSRTFADRVYVFNDWGTKNFWKGYEVGCYSCHNGPSSSSPSTRGFPVVSDRSATTTSGVPVTFSLGTNRIRIVSQPSHGSVAVSSDLATYFPDATFAGADLFTFCSTNDYNDSNLGTARLTVLAPTSQPALVSDTYVFGFQIQTQAVVTFATTLDSPYDLQAADEINGPWSNVAEDVRGHTDSTIVRDGATGGRRFYRSVLRRSGLPSSILTSDSATNSAYDAGWPNGSAGGSGWDAGWVLTTAGASAGHFIGSGGNASVTGRGWGLWANGTSTSTASRVMSQALTVGDALTFRFDNNSVGTGGSVGVSFENAAGESLVDLLFVGGEGTYRVIDADGYRSTVVPWYGGGWDVSFEVSAVGAYTLRMGSYVIPGTLQGVSDRSVRRFKIWNSHAGSGSTYDLYLGELRVVRP